jgi:hypothetical protein
MQVRERSSALPGFLVFLCLVVPVTKLNMFFLCFYFMCIYTYILICVSMHVSSVLFAGRYLLFCVCDLY